MLTYRKAGLCDVDSLAKIRSIFLQEAADISSEDERLKMEAANKTYFETALADDSFVAWLALEDGRIVATSGLSFFVVPPSSKCPNGKVAYIMNMFTFPDYRKQGIAMELLNRTISTAEKRGYRKITLYATDAGRRLYERYGFKDVTGDMEFYIN